MRYWILAGSPTANLSKISTMRFRAWITKIRPNSGKWMAYITCGTPAVYDVLLIRWQQSEGQPWGLGK